MTHVEGTTMLYTRASGNREAHVKSLQDKNCDKLALMLVREARAPPDYG